MRIVFVNSNRCQEGGVETYLDTVMPALQRAGHDAQTLRDPGKSPRVAQEIPGFNYTFGAHAGRIYSEWHSGRTCFLHSVLCRAIAVQRRTGSSETAQRSAGIPRFLASRICRPDG